MLKYVVRVIFNTWVCEHMFWMLILGVNFNMGVCIKSSMWVQFFRRKIILEFFASLITYMLFCIYDYMDSALHQWFVHSVMHLWLSGFCFVFLICTVCYELVIMWVLLYISVLYVLCYDMLSYINHRIPFGDEYVCGLHTHPWIVPFLDSLRLVFNYALRLIFQLLRIFHVFISVVSSLYSPSVDYILYTLHT